MTNPRRIIFVCVIVVGVVVAYVLISPLFITRRVAEELPMVLVNEMAPASASAAPKRTVPVELAYGSFVGLAGHAAQGTARVIEIEGKRYVRFESDFRVTNGPDLFVYLGKNGAYDPNTRLAALKGNEGSQNYELPVGASATHDEVWVWCRAFSVPFGKAKLVPTTRANEG
ncbi:DM13 domain-containing protein [Candidatus Uhrbacteria bacterium]|nr:DM13 domain-containing protein [Candidatus Uhrbacteria bacterium]